MTPEGRVKEDIKRVLRKHNIWWYCPVQNGMGVTGIPDFICCWGGQFLAIEAKAPGKRKTATPNQLRIIDEIINHGGYAFVVDDASQLLEFLNHGGPR